jgi:anti-sigma factor RsiW
MSCDELYERLTDFVDGTLQGDVCGEVERHLAECSDCQHAREDLEDLARLCRQFASMPTLPAPVRARIQLLLSEEEIPPRRPSA